MRHKMSREDRARQFLPFAALRGFGDILREKEKIRVPKTEISDDYAKRLDFKMRQIAKRDIITVTYYEKGEYLKLTGMVARNDPTARILQVVNTKISFENIYDVSGESIRSEEDI